VRSARPAATSPSRQETREARAEDLAIVGQAKIDQLREAALTEVEVSRAKLTTSALPTPSGDAEMTARQDAQVTLDAAPDPLSGLERLARDNDPNVRALAAGSWGRRRLEAAGIPSPDSAHQAVVTQALTYTAEHGTGRRQAAAQAALRLDRKATAAASMYAAYRLGQL
jgi:hypothetical protein